MNINMSERLRMNVSLIPRGAKVADIGCDHGYASIWLVSHGICSRMIALDVNEMPLERASEHICRAGLGDKIECRLSNGTEKLIPGEVDTLMIAGMGGPLMLDILQTGTAVLEEVDTLVLQPQSELAEVRRTLPQWGFAIVEERACVDEGKYYFAIKAQRSQKAVEQGGLLDWEYRYGPCLIQRKDTTLKQYLEKEKSTYLQIDRTLASCEGGQGRRQEIASRLKEINDCIRALQ